MRKLVEVLKTVLACLIVAVVVGAVFTYLWSIKLGILFGLILIVLAVGAYWLIKLTLLLIKWSFIRVARMLGFNKEGKQ